MEGKNCNNQWWQWEQAGRTHAGERSGSACGWWSNTVRDFELARSLGVNALRLSIEWSRVEPRPGEYNREALNRYRTMLQDLVDRGIRPFVCLHHFTDPIWLSERGDFQNEEACDSFERFTRVVVQALGDLCKDWVTFNEPNVYCSLGYRVGEFPPGRKESLLVSAQVLSNICLAHARAYRAIHELQPDANAGWAQHFVIFHPDRENLLDYWAVRQLHRIFNMTFVRAVEHGASPFPLNLIQRLPEVKGTCDFVGLNVYNRIRVRFSLAEHRSLFGRLFVPFDVPQGDHGYEHSFGECYPPGVRIAAEAVRGLRKPIYILENGVPDAQDRLRPWLLREVAKEMRAMLDDGFDLRGYFHWTLTDNFEWNEGWRLRFGLIEMDPRTQSRRPRPSAKLYSSLIRGELEA